MIDRNHRLSVTRQARMLGISRASVYYIPRRVSEADLKLMRAMDELHLEYPFAGSRMLRDHAAPRWLRCGQEARGDADATNGYRGTVHYTLSDEGLENINAKRRPRNKLGKALTPLSSKAQARASSRGAYSYGNRSVSNLTVARRLDATEASTKVLWVFFVNGPPHTFSLQKLDLDYYTITDSVIYICDDH